MFAAVDKLMDFLAHIEHPGSSCSLNLPIGNSGVITCNDGSLVSVIEIRGCRRFIGLSEHKENVAALTTTIRSLFDKKDFDLGFYFESDNDVVTVDRELRTVFSPVKSASNALGLLNEALVEEDIEVLKAHVQVERCWLVCWTLKAKGGIKLAADERMPAAGSSLFRSNYYQDLNGANDEAERGGKHESMLQPLIEVLTNKHFSFKRLSTADIARDLRNGIDARKTGTSWEPLIAGENSSSFLYPAETKRARTEGAAALMPPRLGYQVWPVEPEVVPNKPDTIRVGNRIFKVLALRIMPNGAVPFNKLLKEANRQRIPIRFSGLMHSAGSSFLSVKFSIASLLTIIPFPGRNKSIRDEISRLNRIVGQGSVGSSSLQICFSTWANDDEQKKLDYNADKLMQIINAWNHADAYFLRDDIQQGFNSTLPAYRNASVAPAAVGVLDEILHCMPLTRPVMPFDQGGMCFRSDDGRIMPFQPFDYNVMRHHIYLVVGEPGYGKSATVNNMLVSLVSSSNEIPFIGMADVGTSSLGSILLCQSILPENKKHYAMYHRLRNRIEDAYNFFEPDYGMRMPLKEHFDEICNLMELMLSDDRTSALHSDMPGLIRTVMKLAYRIKSENDSKADPECYRRNKHNDPNWLVIATALEAIDYTPSTDDSWWYIFDKLHNAGYFREASMVQRFAAPTLPFLAAVASRREVREEYPGNYDTGTPLVDYFSRRIGELAEQYPSLATYTQLDLGEARIVSLDLEEVVPRATEHDYPLKKQGAIYFLVAARILASRFFWKEERLSDIPERYHTYHKPYIKSIRQTTNVMMIDELQRFSGVDAADNLCIKIANEGRKWEIGIVLSSQNVTEMPERLLLFSTGRFICGFEEKSVDGVVEKFKLTPTDRELIVNRIHPPSKNGSWLLMQLETDEGLYSHLLNCRMGSEKLWGLSTRNRDSVVRSKVYDVFGDVKGRNLLGRMYPGGSIMDEYNTRIQRLSINEDMGLLNLKEVTQNKNVIDMIADNIIQTGHRLYNEDLQNVDS